MDGASGLPKLLDVHRAAELMSVKPCTVRQERVRGRLGFIRIGARIFYTEELIREYLERQRVPACAFGPEPQNQDKLATTGSANGQTEAGQTMPGIEPGTTKEAAKRAALASARRTFTRRPSS